MSHSTLQKDFFRVSGKWLSHSQMIGKFLNPNLRYIYWLRNASKHSRNSFVGKLYRFILRRYQIRYGYQIPAETQIGEGFYLGHWGALVINPNSIIGKNCNIAQGVTIGQANRGDKKGTPTIGNEVWIGANAVIVGKIIIGDNVLIAPNSYVNMDVPSNSIVIGNPARIIHNDEATKGYINNKV